MVTEVGDIGHLRGVCHVEVHVDTVEVCRGRCLVLGASWCLGDATNVTSVPSAGNIVEGDYAATNLLAHLLPR